MQGWSRNASTGRATDAIPLLRQAIDVFQRAGLADTLAFRSTLAGALTTVGRHDESETELVAILAALGDDDPMTGSIMANLGWNRLRTRQPERAEPWLRRAVAHTESHFGASHPRTANARYDLAVALIERGKPLGALPLLDAALAIELREKSSDSDDVASVRAALARAYLDLGQPARAVELGNQALGGYAKHDDARERGELRWVVARALHATHGDRARVIEPAEQARADLAEAHDGARVAEIDRLLGERRR